MVYGTVSLLMFLIWFFERPEQDYKQLPLINRTPVKKEYTYENPTGKIRALDKEVVQAKVETHKVCVWLKYTLTEEEYDLLCRTTFCEAGNQDLETQVMVCLTILNRIGSDLFPDTVHDVVYQKGAYEVTEWKDFEKYEWDEQVEQAVKIALCKNEYPRNMYYFRKSHYHNFANPYMRSDDLFFSTQKQ